MTIGLLLLLVLGILSAAVNLEDYFTTLDAFKKGSTEANPLLVKLGITTKGKLLALKIALIVFGFSPAALLHWHPLPASILAALVIGGSIAVFKQVQSTNKILK
jgi:hypothetical protein